MPLRQFTILKALHMLNLDPRYFVIANPLKCCNMDPNICVCVCVLASTVYSDQAQRHMSFIKYQFLLFSFTILPLCYTGYY